MKILLLYKSNLEKNSQQVITPNGLMYIATLLNKEGCETMLINISNSSWDEAKEIIKNEKPGLVGISCYTFNRHSVFKLADCVKEVNKKIKVFLGGPHASVMYRQILENCSSVDFIVIGEGETAAIELVENLGQNKDLTEIKGIAYRKEGEVIKTGQREPIEELDSLPIPAQFYAYKRIITSRGCPGKCIFCDTPSLWGQRVRFRSAKNVVDELEMLNKKYGISSFIISDDTFTANKERVIEICREIIRRKLDIVWDCRSRVNLICEERLSWMKKAGCIAISYGVESGSARILKNISKGITKEQIIHAAELTRKFKLHMNFFLIVGSPGEDDSTIDETIEVIEKARPLAVEVYLMQLTPGTAIYESAKKNGFVDDNIWLEEKTEPVYYIYEKDKKTLIDYYSRINRFFNEKAKEYAYKEEELDDADCLGCHNLGVLCLNEGSMDKAAGLFKKAIELNPGYPSAYNNLAVVYAKQGRSDEAAGLFKKAIVMDPEDIKIYANLGLTYYKLKKFDDAIKIFEKAIEIKPEDAELYNYLGSVYGMNGNYEKAISAFKEALKIEPGNKGAKHNLAVAYDAAEK